jgi:hypothetical protein
MASASHIPVNWVSVLNRIEPLSFAQGYREIPRGSRALKVWLTQPRELGTHLCERIQRDIDRLVLMESQMSGCEKIPEPTRTRG